MLSVEEYLEMKQEMKQKIEDSCIKMLFGDFFSCGKEVAERILREPDTLAEQHGVRWDKPIYFSALTFWERKNRKA